MGRKARPLMSAAVTSGAVPSGPLCAQNARVARFSGPRREMTHPPRRRRCRPSQAMKKGRRFPRRPCLNLFDSPRPVCGTVPVENALFPAEIAGFLISSRPVPSYPAFLKYVVPVQEGGGPPVYQSQNLLYLRDGDAQYDTGSPR